MEVAGIINDRNMLVLTLSNEAKRPFLENRAPIWAVIALTPDGDTMKVAHTLEHEPDPQAWDRQEAD